MMPDVNVVSVLIAAVGGMAVGFLWYSPVLFGNQWMKLMGLTKASMEKSKAKMGPMYGLAFVAQLVAAFVLAGTASMTGAIGAMEYVKLGFMIWLGFVATTQLTDVIFGGKTKELYFINTGYQLASYLVMAVILSLL